VIVVVVVAGTSGWGSWTFGARFDGRSGRECVMIDLELVCFEVYCFTRVYVDVEVVVIWMMNGALGASWCG
jgi:hypothetical protein